MSIREGYCAGRKELAATLFERLGDSAAGREALRRLLWSPACCDPRGLPDFFYTAAKQRYRSDVTGFEIRPLAMENIANRFLRVPVTTNWYLPLRDYSGADGYFRALSAKTRKKLRWLDNAYPREKVVIEPIRESAQIADFLDIFAAQWPGSAWNGELKAPLISTFAVLERLGRNRSYLIRDAAGRCVAGSLAYLTDRALNLAMLSRRAGLMDKYSPGFYLVYRMIDDCLCSPETDYFIFGPGEYDYKKKFLGRPIPVYRYEARTWKNAFGVLRLANRYRKELKKRRINR